VRFPPTALQAVVVQQKNTRLPASGSGCDSRPPLRSNAAGTTLATLRKKPGGSNPPGAKALEVSATLVDLYRQQRMPAELLFEERRLRQLLSLRFPAVNAQGTTWTLRVAGSTPARRVPPGGSSAAEQQATSPPSLSPLFFLHRCAPRWMPGLISPRAKVRLLPQRRTFRSRPTVGHAALNRATKVRPLPPGPPAIWVWLNGGALGLEPRECEFDSRHPYHAGLVIW
jgi:hypothetical protein